MCETRLPPRGLSLSYPNGIGVDPAHAKKARSRSGACDADFQAFLFF